jgi:UDP:flavonoid glycosyltransferase YjiC (YdhE family)
MRVLVTAQPAASHLRAVVPAAQAFRRRGHEVLVVAPATQRAEVAGRES